MALQIKHKSKLSLIIWSTLFFLNYTNFTLGMKRKRDIYESQNVNKKAKLEDKDLEKEKKIKKRKTQDLNSYTENKDDLFLAIVNKNLGRIKAIVNLFPEMIHAQWEDNWHTHYRYQCKYYPIYPSFFLLSNSDQDSVLHSACRNRDFGTVEFLLSKRANINATNSKKETPLHLANNIDIVELLVFHGADINGSDNDKNTPLHNAVNRSENGWDIDIVEFLLSQGANINPKGERPLDLAIKHFEEEKEEEALRQAQDDREEEYTPVIELLEFAEHCQRNLEESSRLIVTHIKKSKISNDIDKKTRKEWNKILKYSKYKETPTYAIQTILESLLGAQIQNFISKKDVLELCEKIPFNKRLFNNECKNLKNFILENDYSKTQDKNKRDILKASLVFCKKENKLTQSAENMFLTLFPHKLKWRGITKKQLILFLNTYDTQLNELFEYMLKAKSISPHINQYIYKTLLGMLYVNWLLGQGRNPELISQIISFLDGKTLQKIVSKITDISLN